MRDVLGTMASILAITFQIPYIINVINGKTKPHAITWFAWGLLVWIAFFAQVAGHAGPGAWGTGFDGVMTLIILVLAIYYGTTVFTSFDWVCLFGAALAGLAWIVTDGPLVSVILVSIIDAIAFAPTFRKTWARPDQETLSAYAAAVVRSTFGVLALEHFSIITALYPISLILTEGLFVLMVIYRRGNNQRAFWARAPLGTSQVV